MSRTAESIYYADNDYDNVVDVVWGVAGRGNLDNLIIKIMKCKHDDDDYDDDDDDDENDNVEDVVWGVAGRGKQGNRTMFTCRLFPSYSQIRYKYSTNTAQIQYKCSTNTVQIQHK